MIHTLGGDYIRVMGNEEKKKVRFERYLKHQERTKNIIEYGNSRFDLLIIAISGAGIYVVLEMLKFIVSTPLLIETAWLKGSGLLFSGAIILNFIGQITSMQANSLDDQSSELDIENYLEGINDEQKELVQSLEKKSDNWNNRTKHLNWISAGLMFFGLGIVAVFTALVF